MKTTKIFLCAVLLRAFCPVASGQNQYGTMRSIVVKAVAPCELKITLKGRRIRGWSTTDSVTQINETIGIGKELQYLSAHSMNDVVVYKPVAQFLEFQILFKNKNSGTVFEIHNPIGLGGIVQFDLYKVRNKKLVQIEFNNYEEADLYEDLIINPFATDSTLTTPMYTDYSKIDSGEYLIRGRYKQKCNGKITERYTNSVKFHVIE